MSAFYTATDHFTLLPAILLALFGCVALFFPKMSGLFSLVLGEIFAGIALWRQLNYLQDSGLSIQAFQGSLVVDGLSLFFNFLFVATGLLCGLISYRYLEVEGEHHAQQRNVLNGRNPYVQRFIFRVVKVLRPQVIAEVDQFGHRQQGWQTPPRDMRHSAKNMALPSRKAS